MRLCDYSECTGCMSCVNACLLNCITMCWGENAIDFPRIDETRCIKCGKCVKACPVLAKEQVKKRKPTLEFRAAAMREQKNLHHSSSGGVAYALGQAIIEHGGVVYGAAYNDEMVVEHIEADSLQKLARTQGSKYVQSNIGMCFKKIEQQLKNKRKILFVGLPCQVAGLYQFLGRDDPNLLTVDLLCGGSTSPKLFGKYLRYIERKRQVKITDYNFRSKKYGYGYLCTTTTTTTGEEILLSGVEGSFVTLLGFGYGRKSCFSCPYTSKQRVGDITLGDCWGAESKLNAKGISLIMVNSVKGKTALSDIGQALEFDDGVPVAKLAENIRVLQSPKKMPHDYTDFFNDLDKLSWPQIHKNYVLRNLSPKDRIMLSLPMLVRIKISDTYRKIKRYVKK